MREAAYFAGIAVASCLGAWLAGRLMLEWELAKAKRRFDVMVRQFRADVRRIKAEARESDPDDWWRRGEPPPL